jgi:opacity protein-like surface antigen
MNRPLIYALAFLSGSSINANAESIPSSNPSWYLGIGAGQGEVEVGGHDRQKQVDSILLEQGYEPTNSLGTEEDGTDTWHLNVGYRFDSHWAAELSWINLGDTEGAFYSVISAPVTTPITGEIESEYRSISISGLGFYPIGWGVSLFGRLGVHHWEHDHRFRSNDPQLGFHDTVDSSGNDIVWGGGLSYMPSHKVEFRIEWQRSAGVEDEEGIDNRSLSMIYHF